MFFFALAAAKIIDFSGKTEQFTLTAGQYTIHCYGAQGGQSYKNGNYGARGGYGAHVYGTLTVYGSGTQFYANVGGEGSHDMKGPSLGGFNGGGSSGEDTGTKWWGDPNEGSGGGGGSTDIRINNNNIESRIIVAAGGSGAVYGQNGADGGDENGRWITTLWKVEPSSDTTQTKGNALLQGGDGGSSAFLPGSGGGGGYMGGKGRGGTTKGLHYNAVSDGGSSFISGYKSCSTVDSIVFENASMIVGEENTGNGHIEIFYDFVCSENCYTCKENQTCDLCMAGFSLYKNQCLSECPIGTTSINQVCEECTSPCKTCSSSTTHCESCEDGYHFYDNQCLDKCPLGTVSINFICEICDSSCKTCSGSVSNCESCKDGFYFYDNKCYDECSQLNDVSNEAYFGKDKSQMICQKCSKKNCVSCSADYSICERCSDLYFLSEDTNECILRPTQTPLATPTQTPLATPEETPLATPLATPAQTPLATPAQTPLATPEETPLATPAQTPLATPEETPLATPEETPLATPAQTSLPSDSESGTIVVYPPDCSKSGRYEKIVNFSQKIFVQIKVSTFTNITYDTDGGAIHIINSGIECNTITFSGCKSFKGSGGAVYVSNSYEFNNSIILDYLNFNECEAECGGAIFIHSSSYNNKVSIKHCKFIKNKATGPVPENDNQKYGGAAIFLAARNGVLIRNKFSQNEGAGGSIKLYNIFDNEENKQLRMLNNNDHQFISISSCSFEIEEGSDCSLFYHPSKQGSEFELNDCEFTGILSPGSHFIDGKSIKDGRSKLVVKNCKFSSSIKNSINFDSINFITIDLNEQKFDFNNTKVNKKKNVNGSWTICFVVAVPVVALFVFVIVMKVIKKTSPNILDESLMSHEVEDIL